MKKLLALMFVFGFLLFMMPVRATPIVPCYTGQVYTLFDSVRVVSTDTIWSANYYDIRSAPSMAVQNWIIPIKNNCSLKFIWQQAMDTIHWMLPDSVSRAAAIGNLIKGSITYTDTTTTYETLNPSAGYYMRFAWIGISAAGDTMRVWSKLFTSALK